MKAEIEYAEADQDEREKFAWQFLQDLASKPDSVVVLFQDEDIVEKVLCFGGGSSLG